MKRIVLLLVLTSLFSSCEEEKIIFVADHQVSCADSTLQNCMLIKENESDEWQKFGDSIKGFSYEEGYAYQIKIKVKKIASSTPENPIFTYSLIDIISKTRTQKDNITMVYSATSRGFGSVLQIKDGILTYDIKRPSPKETQKTLSTEDLNSLLELVDLVDIKQIETLEPPSKAHQYDGAPGAVFKIIINGKEYRTPTFDYGNPPEVLQALIQKMEDLK